VDDCPGSFFITVGTWAIGSKKWVLSIWQKDKKGNARPDEAGADLVVSHEIIGRGGGEGDHRDQPLDLVIVLALLARQRWRARLESQSTSIFNSCFRVHRGLCWCQCVLFREKRLKLVMVNRKECERQLF